MSNAGVRIAIRCTLVAIAAGAAVALASIAQATSATPSDTILSGTTLYPGQDIKSTDGHYMLAMQTDGNLVVYWMNGTAIGHAIWSSHTHGDDGARAVLQDNGNLVLYSPGDEALWSSNTSGAGCSDLVMQGDGNLVLYDKTHSTWASSTVQHELTAGDELYPGTAIYSPGEEYEVTMQTDGNFVLYGPPGALWSTQTNGILGSHAIMQSDGNLVVYSNGGRALWNSHTNGDAGAYAISQADGNFVIYAGGKARWDTATNGRKPSSGPNRYGKPAFVPCPAAPPPTTTTTTPPPASSTPDPVVSVPTATRFPRLRVRILIHWTWDYAVTRLHRISVPRMPRDATFWIKCTGHGCRGHARAKARQLRRLLRKLEGHEYHAGDRIEITITERRHKAERVQISIRDGRGPRARVL